MLRGFFGNLIFAIIVVRKSSCVSLSGHVLSDLKSCCVFTYFLKYQGHEFVFSTPITETDGLEEDSTSGLIGEDNLAGETNLRYVNPRSWGPVSGNWSRELYGPENSVVKLQSADYEKLIF